MLTDQHPEQVGVVPRKQVLLDELREEDHLIIPDAGKHVLQRGAIAGLNGYL
jgi:hypothetical protein